jgi:hypothetical protein
MLDASSTLLNHQHVSKNKQDLDQESFEMHSRVKSSQSFFFYSCVEYYVQKVIFLKELEDRKSQLFKDLSYLESFNFLNYNENWFAFSLSNFFFLLN